MTGAVIITASIATTSTVPVEHDPPRQRRSRFVRRLCHDVRSTSPRRRPIAPPNGGRLVDNGPASIHRCRKPKPERQRTPPSAKHRKGKAEQEFSRSGERALANAAA